MLIYVDHYIGVGFCGPEIGDQFFNSEIVTFGDKSERSDIVDNFLVFWRVIFRWAMKRFSYVGDEILPSYIIGIIMNHYQGIPIT